MIPSLALILAASCGDIPARPLRSTFPALARPAIVHADTQPDLSAKHREANRLANTGKFNRARVEYLTVIALMDSSAAFPGEVLWSLASMEYGRNRELSAAAILDRLADASVRYGRPEWQARALLEAGLIYQNHGRTDLSVNRVRTLKPLLSSPAISASERAQMAGRVAMKTVDGRR